MKRLLALASVAALGAVVVPTLARAGQEDQATGSGKLAGQHGIVSAHGTPAAARGQVQLQTAAGNFKGDVDCLNVFPITGGLRAILEGNLDNPPGGRYRAIIDDLGNGQGTGQPDRANVQPSRSDQGCQPQEGDATAQIEQGNFELKDRSP